MTEDNMPDPILQNWTANLPDEIHIKGYQLNSFHL